MHVRSSPAAMLALLALLLGVLYPAVALKRVVAPEASLRAEAPWRLQWGPFPPPLPEQVRAATELGPRLTLLQRDLLDLAVWNPWIGGGRPGWLASAREGGAPLPLLAVLLARPGNAWTALVALAVAVAFLSAFWMLSRLGLPAGPAAVGATCYALAGPLTSHWLDWQSSALALGPLAVGVALGPPGGVARGVARWGAVLAVLGLCGPPAAPFVALAAMTAVLHGTWGDARRRLGLLLLGGLLATALLAPRLWLVVAGREPGAPAVTPSIEAPLASAARIALPPVRLDPAAPLSAQRAADGRGFLGLVTLGLALVGLWAAPRRQRGLWGAALLLGGGLALAPGSWLTQLGLGHRPLGVLALAAATLAAFGCQRLLGGLAGTAQTVAALGLGWLVLWTLLPEAITHVPFAARAEAALPPPLPPAASPVAGRVVGLLGCLPPDAGSATGIADVRASFFDGEPAYAGRLGAGPGGAISVSRALSPALAGLGARTLVEPLPLRVVSSELFSRVEIVDLEGGPAQGGVRRYRLPQGSRLSRLGLPTTLDSALPARLAWGQKLWPLGPDSALATESDEWRWLSIPAPASSAQRDLILPESAPTRLPVALDHSGLRQVAEGGGVRVWEWDQAVPFAALTWPLGEARPPEAGPCRGVVRIDVAETDRLLAAVESHGSCTLQVQVKYRPGLWRATVGGQSAQLLPCGEVWSCVPVPRGASRVELKARLPWPAMAVPLLGLLGLVGLAWTGRKP